MIPPQPECERQVTFCAPVILSEETEVPVSEPGGSTKAMLVTRRPACQKVARRCEAEGPCCIAQIDESRRDDLQIGSEAQFVISACVIDRPL